MREPGRTARVVALRQVVHHRRQRDVMPLHVGAADGVHHHVAVWEQKAGAVGPGDCRDPVDHGPRVAGGADDARQRARVARTRGGLVGGVAGGEPVAQGSMSLLLHAVRGGRHRRRRGRGRVLAAATGREERCHGQRPPAQRLVRSERAPSADSRGAPARSQAMRRRTGLALVLGLAAAVAVVDAARRRRLRERPGHLQDARDSTSTSGPTGIRYVKAYKFPAQKAPSLTVYRRGSVATRAFFFFLSARGFNYANTCDLATNPLSTSWKGGPRTNRHGDPARALHVPRDRPDQGHPAGRVRRRRFPRPPRRLSGTSSCEAGSRRGAPASRSTRATAGRRRCPGVK